MREIMAEDGALMIRGCLGSGVRALDEEASITRRVFEGVVVSATGVFVKADSAAARSLANFSGNNLFMKDYFASSTTGAN